MRRARSDNEGDTGIFCGPKCKNVKLLVGNKKGDERVACGARKTLTGHRSLEADWLRRLPAPNFVPMAYAVFPMSNFMKALDLRG